MIKPKLGSIKHFIQDHLAKRAGTQTQVYQDPKAVLLIPYNTAWFTLIQFLSLKVLNVLSERLLFKNKFLPLK